MVRGGPVWSLETADVGRVWETTAQNILGESFSVLTWRPMVLSGVEWNTSLNHLDVGVRQINAKS